MNVCLAILPRAFSCHSFWNMGLPELENSEIESLETPSYLEELHESNAILFRKKKNETSRNFDNVYNKHEMNNGVDDLNLTGTPLDCPFQTTEELDISLGYDLSTVKWRKNEENHFPFKINDAIRFLTAYNLDHKEDGALQNKTVWVALDSKDSRSTVLMGLLVEGDWRIRKTVCQSKIPLDGVQAYGERVIKRHMMMSGVKENNSKCKVSVAYDVVRKIDDSDAANGVPSIKLYSTWHTSLLRKGLTMPPPEASTTVSVEIVTGSKQSKIHHFWNQLVFLNELVGMTSRKEVSFPESVLKRVDTMDRVIELVKAEDGYEMKCGGLAAKDVCAENISEVVQGERDTRDFPSKLWELLICCQSCSELVECFEYVCEEAERGEITPYIHPQNKTCFSTLILDLCTGGAMPKYFSITEARALDMLKEMGLHALQQSYTHILLTFNWCSSYQLDANIPKDNKMARLSQLHVILDLFLTMQQHINLPLQCIQSLFSIAIVKFLAKLNSFEDILEKRIMTFSHALRTTDVACHLTKHFTSWELQIETDSRNENLRLSTTCNVSNESIFPPPLALPVLEESNADNNSFGDIPLFTAQLTVIGNKIINNFDANCNS